MVKRLRGCMGKADLKVRLYEVHLYEA